VDPRRGYDQTGDSAVIKVHGALLATLFALTLPGLAQPESARFPVEVLVQSPAETQTQLQVICLFRSEPANTLHGSLTELDQELGGLLTQIRKESLFTGALGETLLITPKPGSIHARKLLLIGLGDLQGFSPAREQLVGTVVFQEAAQLGIANPYFAPTVLDGGKAGIDTGDTAEQFLYGFLRARATELALHAAGMASGDGPVKLTFLAGAAHAESTRAGVAKALGK
jgi:hypothetical protein